MNPRTWTAVMLLAASCDRRPAEPAAHAGSSPQLSPESTVSPGAQRSPGDPAHGAADPAGSASAAASAAAPPPIVAKLPRAGSARDDLAHRRRDLAWLAGKIDCVPALAPARPDGPELALALDSYGGRLVLCAQASTRRGVSVFFDDVSYACWNVDPATAAVARRADLGRAFFRCQDGACQPDADGRAVSYDGAAELVFSADQKELAIVGRPGGARVRAFPLAGESFLRGELTLVGRTIFAIQGEEIAVLDDRGARVGKLAGPELRVLDADLVLAVRDEAHGTLYDLAARRETPVQLAVPYVAGAVRHAGEVLAVDGAARALVRLDPATLRPLGSRPLPRCR
jgi:hypothetical protein